MAKKTTPGGTDKPVRRARTAEDVERHKAIRDRFQREKPSLEQLVSSGEYNEPLPMGEHLSIRQAVFALKKGREAAGLSLADVAERTGIDKAALSRIESGQHMNPTVSTLCRYAHALGKRWKWVLEDAGAPGKEQSPAGLAVIEAKRTPETPPSVNPFYAHVEEVRKCIELQQEIETKLLERLQESRKQAAVFIRNQRLTTELMQHLLEEYHSLPLLSGEAGTQSIDVGELVSLARHLLEKTFLHVEGAGGEEPAEARDEDLGITPRRPEPRPAPK